MPPDQSGSAKILPFRRTKLPAIDTLWVDVSAPLLLPNYIAGITRTIRKIVEVWLANPWTQIRYCAVTPGVGLTEVDRDYVFPAGTLQPEEWEKPSSRFWYVPWTIRHSLRKFWMDPQDGPPPRALVQEPPTYAPYPKGSIRGPLELGPRDLVFSLGGLWIVPDVSNILVEARKQSRFNFVSLVYDLIPFMAPQFCSPALVLPTFTPCTRMQLNESDVLLTISEYSRQDIVKYAKENFVPIWPIESFTLGCDIQPLAATAVGPSEHRRPFVLSVGSVEVRKNHYGMYQAWRKLLKEHGPERTPDLVFAGKPGWQGDSILYLVQNDPLVRDKIIVKSGICDKELDWLYKNCLFTLYPSLYEGWGLPVEESFVYGKLCITTTASSLPEVGREFADYVEPESVDGICSAVLRAMDDDYRHSREELIRQKYKPNTWEQSADQLRDILEGHFQFQKASRLWRRAA